MVLYRILPADPTADSLGLSTARLPNVSVSHDPGIPCKPADPTPFWLHVSNLPISRIPPLWPLRSVEGVAISPEPIESPKRVLQRSHPVHLRHLVICSHHISPATLTLTLTLPS